MTFHSRTLALLASAILVPTAGAATIGGRVFEDFNANGGYDTGSTIVANDVGIAGVALSVTNARGKSIARVVTGVDGTWTAQAPAGWIRIAATELPPGYEPGPHGANSGTTVQFVNTADAVADDRIDIGIAQPSNYCEDNPNLALPCARSQSAKIDQGAFFLFPLSASSDPDGNADGSFTGNDRTLGTRPTVLALASQVGMLNGVAWNRRSQTLYGSAYLRRRTGFGPGGIGAIYAVTSPGTPGAPVTTFVDLNAVFGAGTAGVDPHVPGDLIDDGASVPLVGKAGIGDIDISPDGRTLYAVNLTDRKLYAIPTTGTPSRETIARIDLPLAQPDCAEADVRPFGLGVDGAGNVYIGGVCSAESTGNAEGVRAYVWRYNGTSTSLVLNAPLGKVAANYRHDWNAWVNTDNVRDLPQPMLSDIGFDRGDLILGFRDRFGDIIPAAGKEPSADPNPQSNGETLIACPGGPLGFVLESGGACAARSTTSDGPMGPGGKSFYWEDRAGDGGGESSQGGMAQIPGFPFVLSTAMDPVLVDSTGAQIESVNNGGVQRYSNTSGDYVGGYEVYTTNEDGTFSKGNGLGDIEALCSSAPLEIGNRVWIDLNRNGQQDAGETPIARVSVELWLSGKKVAETTTDEAGQYYFNAANVEGGVQPETKYEVRIPLKQKALAGLTITKANGGKDRTDSDCVKKSGNGRIDALTRGPGANDHTFDCGFNRGLVTLKKKAASKRVNAGGTVAFTIRLFNAGPGTAKDLEVCDLLPGGLEVLERGGGRIRGSRLCWQIKTLGAKRSRLFTIRVKTDIDACGRRTNRAEVGSGGSVFAKSDAQIKIVRCGTDDPVDGVTG